MTDITQESLQKKQEAIDLLAKRYRGLEQRTEDIDLRLRLYFEDLLEHSSAKEDDDNDWHGIYELLGAAKFLRMLDTYNFNVKKVQTVIRLREGEWVPVGKYPNYMSVIPQDAPYSLTADRPALLKALRNVAHFTPGSSRLVKLTMLSNQTMELRGEDFDFSTEATDRIGIDYPAGRDMTLGVKADSIIDELSRIIEPKVTMHFTDQSRAVTINPIDPLYQGEEITMLLMPMLVNV